MVRLIAQRRAEQDLSRLPLIFRKIFIAAS
jgi:hypothetical protein